MTTTTTMMILRAGCVRSRAWTLSSAATTSGNLHPLGRAYSRTTWLLEDGGGGGGGGEATATAAASDADSEEQQQKQQLLQLHRWAAQDYNNRRAAYTKQVGALRKQYAAQVAQQRAQDKAAKEQLERELTRKRLERQRRKNQRSALHAAAQEAFRLQKQREFNEHLEQEQVKRQAKKERFAKARQIVIDELEEEAPLWLTTREEVEAAFSSHEAQQLLWAPQNGSGGVLGAPNPSLDCHFWQYETHTWHMNKTYSSQRQVLLQELQDDAYRQSNVDQGFWSQPAENDDDSKQHVPRQQEREALETKARLRAMVHSAGRSELLRKQKQLLQQDLLENEYDNDDDDEDDKDGGDTLKTIPKPTPIPNLRMLNDHVALEREGARLLMEDPTKFFVFEDHRSGAAAADDDAVLAGNDDNSRHYSGPTLGSPIGLRDALRQGISHSNKSSNSVFPEVIGKIPKPDTRTEREKKQQERQDRLLASAAQAQAIADAADSSDDGVAWAAQQESDSDLEPDLDYDVFADEWDKDDDEEWRKGLDPTVASDAAILETPRERRYNASDVEWVVKRLEDQVEYLEQQFKQDVESLKRSSSSSSASLSSPQGETGGSSSTLEAAILSLSDKELLVLSDLQDRYAEEKRMDDDNIDNNNEDADVDVALLDELVAEAAQQVPGLSQEQIRIILLQQ